MTAPRRSYWIGITASSAILITGVILLAVSLPTAAASFGWFAYQPLANATIFPGVVTSPAAVAGTVLIVLGLIGLAFTNGVAVGRRSAARRG